MHFRPKSGNDGTGVRALACTWALALARAMMRAFSGPRRSLRLKAPQQHAAPITHQCHRMNAEAIAGTGAGMGMATTAASSSRILSYCSQIEAFVSGSSGSIIIIKTKNEGATHI